MSRIGKSTETGNKLPNAQKWGKKEVGSDCVSFWADRNILGLDNVDNFTL
jgi:hypothetical protein